MGRTECGEEMDLCEHAETVLRLGKEVTRKEHQVKREQRLKHEFGMYKMAYNYESFLHCTFQRTRIKI